ncbi:MAG: hypothetical protein NWF06_05715 [Candidatus Bathyarchaeota archaeon]|nr:hypothetical protein [Candidatus Bathyarchaeum sp.]
MSTSLQLTGESALVAFVLLLSLWLWDKNQIISIVLLAIGVILVIFVLYITFKLKRDEQRDKRRGYI